MNGWDEQLTDMLIECVLKSDNRDWQQIASVFPNKTPQDCEKWWDFLISVESILQEYGLTKAQPEVRKRVIPQDNSSADDASKKRQRRTANLIDRKYRCPAPDCPRAYGTEGALKFHIKSKHKDQSFSPPQRPPANSNASSSPPPPPISVRPGVSPVLMQPRNFSGMGLSSHVFPPTFDFMDPFVPMPDISTIQNQLMNPNMLKVLMNPIIFDPNDKSDKGPFLHEIGIPLPEDMSQYTQILSQELPVDHRFVIGPLTEFPPPNQKT
jgi:hypothetical protein